MNIIEIGANNGLHSYTYSRIAKKLWCFEPIPFFFEKLKERFKNCDNVEIIGMAVSDFDGESTFNITKDVNSSSLYDLSEFTINRNLIQFSTQVNVKVTRMDTFINQNGIETIDYLHCDAQGNDLTILKSFGDKLSIINKGKIEVTMTSELYKNVTNDFDSVVKFLKDNNFGISNFDELIKMKGIKYDGNLEFYNKKTTNLI